MGAITWGTLAAVLAAPLVFFLPGWALLSLLVPYRSRWLASPFPATTETADAGPEQPGEQGQAEPIDPTYPDAASWFILSAGVTLALIPVLMLLCYLAGVRIGTGLVLSGLGLSGAVILWRQGRGGWRAWRASSWRERLASPDAPLFALVGVSVLVLGVRLWVVRGLNEGFWGDSYQHTLISQLLLDNGGLFASWEPYAPLKTFTYHFGFHAHVAVFQWATGWLAGNATPRTLVLVGQFLNALAVLALYPLTLRLTHGNRWAGVVAVLVGGLLAPMPMYYVNWGRYTQLAGQAILPGAMWFVMEAVEVRRWHVGRLAVAGLMLAGLYCTHYRVVVLLVIFLVPYLLYAVWKTREGRRLRIEPVARLASVGALGLAVSGPWLANTLQAMLPAVFSFYVTGVRPEVTAEVNSFGPLSEYMSYPLLVLAGLGVLLSLRHARRPVFLVGPWAALVLLAANPGLVGLPGSGLIGNFAVLIALYLPVAVLVGFLAAEGGAALSRVGQAVLRTSKPRLAAPLALAVIVGLGAWGARDRAAVINPFFQMVTPADEQAMAWIQNNTPAEARFLVNAFFAYGNTVTVGSDAGWWIPLLARRANTVPPLPHSTEASFVPDYVNVVNRFVRTVQQSPLDSPATIEFLRQNRVTHVYIGAKGGTVGATGEPLLDPAELQRHPAYRLIYQQGGVWIFEIAPAERGR